MADGYVFEEFVLDPADRRLLRHGEAVDLNARYFDALHLLVAERGRLVTKDRFLDEVWAGIPVTDEALTQCVRSLRRVLGDDATRPRFIETVPKHGYRFIAAGGSTTEPESSRQEDRIRHAFLLALAGTVGAGLAGLVGGFGYGLAGAASPLDPAVGAASLLLVLTAIATLVALVGGFGVSLGIAAGQGMAAERSSLAPIAGGAIGGLIVGALGKMIGQDAFHVLVGRSPGDITGAAEGIVLGAAAGAGWWLAHREAIRRPLVVSAAVGAAAGIVLGLIGRPLLLGSLARLAGRMPDSALRSPLLDSLDPLGTFDSLMLAAVNGVEGGLFVVALVAAMRIADRQLAPRGAAKG